MEVHGIAMHSINFAKQEVATSPNFTVYAIKGCQVQEIKRPNLAIYSYKKAKSSEIKNAEFSLEFVIKLDSKIEFHELILQI